ncbi:MAG TPA: hypothetical protein PK379_06410 [Candidatus Hydrogenedentes bacterium]|nr:hypothetical protein [Candidatus Hydrogenedentota bacterium]HOJ67487.1 hypothetical protein [Candidatus Hydrogenedentota bacterium]HOK89641.1 hypothetical protein [Candidatus Hydrogenedentota bacterium]
MVMRGGPWLLMFVLTCAGSVSAQSAAQSPAPTQPPAASGPDLEARTLNVHVWAGSGQRGGDQIQFLPDAASAEPLQALSRELPYATLRHLDSFTIGDDETSVERPLSEGIQFQYKRGAERDGPWTALVRVRVPSPENPGETVDAIRSTIRLEAGQGVLLRGIPRGSEELLVLVSRPASNSNQAQQNGDNKKQDQQQQENQPQQQDQQQQAEQQDQKKNSDSQEQQSSNENQERRESPELEPKDQDFESQENQDKSEASPENESSMENIKGLLDTLEETDQQERKEQLRQLRNRVEVQGDWW